MGPPFSSESLRHYPKSISDNQGDFLRRVFSQMMEAFEKVHLSEGVGDEMPKSEFVDPKKIRSGL